LVPASIDFCGSPREQECRASHETNHISKEWRIKTIEMSNTIETLLLSFVVENAFA